MFKFKLIGDFNSKTGTLSDYIVPDDSIVNMFDLDSDSDILEYMYDYQNLVQYNIPLQRVTKCVCKPNNYGHKLLNLCKKNKYIYIANSRVGDDNGIGEKTCKDKSVVDYLLLSSQLFPLIKQFKMEDFIPLYSDCHSLLQFSFQSREAQVSTDELINDDTRDRLFVKWNCEKKFEYVNYIHSDYDGVLLNVLADLDDLSSRANIRQTDIDNAVKKLRIISPTGRKKYLTISKTVRNIINKTNRNRGSIENVL